MTLLHDMAHEGDIPKAMLLLDHGADINPIDEEYQSTPLGMAARWGRRYGGVSSRPGRGSQQVGCALVDAGGLGSEERIP